MIHSSYSSIKNIDGGANSILSVLKEEFKDGCVMLPAHTWNSINEDNMICDLQEANSCVGYLTNMAILDKDFTWILVALLWGNVAIMEYFDGKLLKGSEALNDIGLKKDKVITSLGNFNIDNNGDNKFKIKSIKPLDIIILDAKIIAKIDGNKFKEILIPSLIPLINASYIFIFL